MFRGKRLHLRLLVKMKTVDNGAKVTLGIIYSQPASHDLNVLIWFASCLAASCGEKIIFPSVTAINIR